MEDRNPETIISKATSWYLEKRLVYEQLSKKVESIIQEIILDHKIHIHAIYSRTKDLDSFTKKIEDSKYNDPINQITDYSGIRIITYVESDLEKVCKVLETHFTIDPQNSIDKSKSLGVDKVGYRSIHYVSKLPSDRLKLPEYKKFKGLFFEIQVRTILQHGWAEIEHDKDYKFSGELPTYLKRRFKILAGVLELADREFDQLAREIDKYSLNVVAETKKGKLNITIDSTSIKSYLEVKLKDLIKNGMPHSFKDENTEKMILLELRNFGISTLKELDTIIPKDIIPKYINYIQLEPQNLISYTAFLRHVMIINDAEKYFNDCWKLSWSAMHKKTINLIKSYKIPIDEILVKFKIKIF